VWRLRTLDHIRCLASPEILMVVLVWTLGIARVQYDRLPLLFTNTSFFLLQP
jgi:hypothetical protein